REPAHSAADRLGGPGDSALAAASARDQPPRPLVTGAPRKEHMLGRSTMTRKRAGEATELARRLAGDKKFRKQLLSAVKHTDIARGRTRRALGLSGTLRRLATDETLRSELRGARKDLRRAYGRLEQKNRSHRLRN